jgi:Tfp pilus assembly protein FimV
MGVKPMLRKSIFGLAMVSVLAVAGYFVFGSTDKDLLVGEVQLQSALNQTLKAEVTLATMDRTPLQGIQVRLASAEAFAEAGLERPAWLADLHFVPMKQGDGGQILAIASTKPINEPVVDFLVDIHWEGGQARHEFTLLLDPPKAEAPADPETIADKALPAPEPEPGLESMPEQKPEQNQESKMAALPEAAKAAEAKVPEPVVEKPAQVAKPKVQKQAPRVQKKKPASEPQRPMHRDESMETRLAKLDLLLKSKNDQIRPD